MEKKEKRSTFAGFILLSEAKIDKEKIKKDLLSDWGIKVIKEKDGDETEDTLVFDTDEMTVALSLVKSPVPNGEAEQNASANYMWQEAVEITKTHRAQIIVAILGNKNSVLDTGKLYVKICSSVLKQKNAIGIYTSGTVFEPNFYIKFSEMIKENELPIYNFVHVGLYKSGNGMNGYTYGMRMFGKEEMEIIESKKSPNEMIDFLYGISGYVLENDVTFKDGETIGFSENDKHNITHGKSVSLNGDSFRIEF